jgi:GNAT superfamily N-acetyltransferase
MPATPLPVEYSIGTPADALCVSVAAIHVFLDTYATEGLRPDLAREAISVYAAAAFLPRLADPATTFVLAMRGEHLLGFAEVTRQRPCACASERFTVELVRLYVLPVAQGQGLGRALLAYAEGMLAQEGAFGLWLAAWSGNQRALSFYPSVGYTPAGLTEYAIEGVVYENQVFVKPFAA